MNKTMKAILCALLAALLCTGLLACAKTPDKDSQNSDSGSGSAKRKRCGGNAAERGRPVGKGLGKLRRE